MRIVTLLLLIFAFVSQANAQTRCECEYDDWVDDCDAEFERKGDWILFKSDTEQCSRIDWYTDSQPRLTIVEDGKETVNLTGIPSSAEISIASCKVCKDRMYSERPDVDRSRSGSNAISGNRKDHIDTIASVMYDSLVACRMVPEVSRDEYVANLIKSGNAPRDRNDLRATVRDLLSSDLDSLAENEVERNKLRSSLQTADAQVKQSTRSQWQKRLDEINRRIDYLVKSRDRSQCLVRQIG